MNREIKFRGLTVQANWVYGYLLARDIDTGGLYIRVMSTKNEPPRYSDHWVDSDTVGQYTGLKDRNGVEIYEGDICEAKFHFRGGDIQIRRGVVSMDDDIYMWVIECKNKQSLPLQRITAPVVIGNMHENPESLTSQ